MIAHGPERMFRTVCPGMDPSLYVFHHQHLSHCIMPSSKAWWDDFGFPAPLTSIFLILLLPRPRRALVWTGGSRPGGLTGARTLQPVRPVPFPGNSFPA